MASVLQQKIEVEAKAFQGLQKGAQAILLSMACCFCFQRARADDEKLSIIMWTKWCAFFRVYVLCVLCVPAPRRNASRFTNAFVPLADHSKMVQTQSKLVGQHNENDMVLKELNLLEDEANVYKLVGPVLLKQDLDEAKSNVEKRLQYIGDEM
jgi:hypothetical protein